MRNIITTINNMRINMECSHCGYEWTPRKARPKCCPMCKRYLAALKAPKIDQIPEPVNKIDKDFDFGS